MFHVLFGLPALYVVSRWLWPLPLPLPASIVLALAVLLASQYHLLCRISSGSPFAPEMPRRWVIALNWALRRRWKRRTSVGSRSTTGQTVRSRRCSCDLWQPRVFFRLP
jgi:hypothetical protein